MSRLALARWPTFAAVLEKVFAFHDGCHFCIVVFILLSIGYVVRSGGLGCGKLSTVGRVGGETRFCGEVLGFIGEFPASSDFVGLVLGVFVGLQGSNEVETVLFPFVPID